jgi:hypothetical protein
LTPKKVAPRPDDVDLPAVPCGKNEANYSLKHDEIEKEVVEMASQSKLGMINMSRYAWAKRKARDPFDGHASTDSPNLLDSSQQEHREG